MGAKASKCTCRENGLEPIVEVMSYERIGPYPDGSYQVLRLMGCRRCGATWEESVAEPLQKEGSRP